MAMARIRSIKPTFWEDEKIAKLSLQARLTFIGLLNFSDDAGTIKANPAYIKSRIFPYDDSISANMVKKWIDEIIALDRAVQIEYNGEVFYHIRNFLIHQRIDKRYADYVVPIETLKTLSALNPRVSHGEPAGTLRELDAGEERRGEERIGENTPAVANATATLPPPSEIEVLFKEFQEWIKKHAPTVGKMKEPINLTQFGKLRKEFSKSEISVTLLEMHNWKPLVKKKQFCVPDPMQLDKQKKQKNQRTGNKWTNNPRTKRQGDHRPIHKMTYQP